MNNITRRNFLKSSLITGVTASLSGRIAGASAVSRVRGANEDIRVAVVGINGKGAQHIDIFHKLPGVRVVALCDVDRAILGREAKKFEERNEKVDTYTDFRRVLDDKNIDVIVNATPDHWHGLHTIWTCQANKDLYIEKPTSHNVLEGYKMVEAARKYNCIVQAGTQRRSDEGMQQAVDYLQKGNLGKIHVARCLAYASRKSLGKICGPQKIPDTVDYDLWTGPAPMQPLTRNNLHYDWRFFWPIGSGDLPNNGIHFFDLARWIIGQNDPDVPVMSVGGRFVWDDTGETPNTQFAIFDGDTARIVVEVRNLPRKTGDAAMDNYRRIRMGLVVECEGGYFADGAVFDNQDKKIKQFPLDGGSSHQANFINAVRSRKVADLNADILEGHISSAMCLLANISYRVGSALPREQITEAIKSDELAAKVFDDFCSHLQANDVDLSNNCAILGPTIRFNSKTRRLREIDRTTDLLADSLLTGSYRQPYVLPEKI